MGWKANVLWRVMQVTGQFSNACIRSLVCAFRITILRERLLTLASYADQTSTQSTQSTQSFCFSEIAVFLVQPLENRMIFFWLSWSTCRNLAQGWATLPWDGTPKRSGPEATIPHSRVHKSWAYLRSSDAIHSKVVLAKEQDSPIQEPILALLNQWLS